MENSRFIAVLHTFQEKRLNSYILRDEIDNSQTNKKGQMYIEEMNSYLWMDVADPMNQLLVLTIHHIQFVNTAG